MFTRGKTLLAVTAPAVAPLAVDATTAGDAAAAGRYYSDCDALHHDFEHGVAKSKKAAQRQVRAGYGLPSYGRARPSGLRDQSLALGPRQRRRGLRGLTRSASRGPAAGGRSRAPISAVHAARTG